jgi:hypothetical protein
MQVWNHECGDDQDHADGDRHRRLAIDPHPASLLPAVTDRP